MGSARRLRHRPGLDGLRGLALLAVLCFHAELSWARGGALGVSLFFTLSGFLICTILLLEVDAAGRVSLARFWSARLRRLAPAAITTVLGITLVTAAGHAPWSTRSVTEGVIPALTYTTNWAAIATERSYAEIFAGPSPFDHYWSLAIEEQFYLVFPLLVTAAALTGAWRRAVLAGGVVLGILASGLWLRHLAETPDRWYYGSAARAPEILVGVLGAALLTGRRLDRFASARTTQVLGIGAIVTLLGFWSNVARSEPFLARGGIIVHAGLALVVTVAACGDGPTSRILAVSPLQWLGRISYAAYLFHWPIFIWLRVAHDLAPLSVLVIGSMLTATAAHAFTTLIEQPVRTRRWSIVGVSGALVTAATISVALTIAPWSDRTAGRADQIVAALDELEQAEVLPEVSAPPAPTATSAPTPPPMGRVLLVGDSVMSQAADAHRRLLEPLGLEVRYIGGPASGPLHPQDDWLVQLERWIEGWQPTTVVLEACCDYTYERPNPYLTVDGDSLRPGTPEVYAAYAQEVSRLLDVARSGGAEVHVVIAPPASTNGFYGPIESHIERTNDILRSSGALVIDWSSVLAPDGTFTTAVDGQAVRHADGVHLTPAGSELAARTTAEALMDRSSN